jgi:cytochrome c oxidase subunit 5b
MSLIHRAGVLQMAVKSRAVVATLVNGQRAFASDPPSKDEYPTNVDPVEWAVGQERKILLARLAGDDVSLSVVGKCELKLLQRYEAKVFRRGPGTKDVPNLIPSMFDNRLIACQCRYL